MMKRIKFLSAQSTSEYVVLLAIVVAALISMQVYLKRGIQGRIRDLADQISPTHYEQRNTYSEYNITQSGNLIQRYSQGVADLERSETISRVGYETVIPETQ